LRVREDGGELLAAGACLAWSSPWAACPRDAGTAMLLARNPASSVAFMFTVVVVRINQLTVSVRRAAEQD